MAKAQSASKKAQSAAYKLRYTKNRERKLQRALKRNPNNEQITVALKNIHYRRKDPKSQQWSKQRIQVAKLFKEFCGRMSYEVFNANPQVAQGARSKLGHGVAKVPSLGKVSFALGARAHNSDGTLVWK